MRKINYSAIADKKIDEKTTTELVRIVEDYFTQRIHDALPPKKFGQHKFNIYDCHSYPADHVCHYKQVMAH